MTTDEIQLLRDFRSDIPEPDEETVRRAYAYATTQPRAARRLPLRLPATTRTRVLGIAAVAGAAALIGFFAMRGTSPHQAALTTPLFQKTVPAMQVPATQVPLSDAVKAFDAPIILPDIPLLQPSDADPAAYAQWCPAPEPGVHEPICQLDVQFPAQSVEISYQRWSLPFSAYPSALAFYETDLQADTNPGKQIVYLSGIPALLLPKQPGHSGSIDFQLDGTRIIIFARDYDAAQMQALAQSIVDQAGSANP